MKKFFSSKSGAIVFELLKWCLVLWLLLPIRNLAVGKIDFVRVLTGICLFLIFAGKVFYDVVLDSFRKQRDEKALTDFIFMVGVISVMVLVVAGIVVLVGIFIFSSVQSWSAPNYEN